MSYEASSAKVIEQRAASLAEYLRTRTGRPVPAIELGNHLSIKGNRENKRRKAREAVTFAREQLAHRICASPEGYWLARDNAEWEEYQQSVRDKAVFRFVSMRQTAEAVRDRLNRQMRLFA